MEKTPIIKRLAPFLIVGGVVVLLASLATGILTIGEFLNGIEAGIVAGMVMAVAMMGMDAMKMVEVHVPKMVTANLGMESMWMPIHFLTAIAFAELYIILSNALGIGISVLSATIYGILVPMMLLDLVILPDNGLGAFGMKKSMMLAMMTVVMHILYGASVGITLVSFPMF